MSSVRGLLRRRATISNETPSAEERKVWRDNALLAIEGGDNLLCNPVDDLRLLAERDALAAENTRLREAHGILCGVCRLTCEIPHKAVAIQFVEGRLTWFHDAHEKDCWEALKRYVLALP